MDFSKFDKALLANTSDAYLKLLSSDANWFARNFDDLNALRTMKGTPLDKLSTEDFNDFLSGIEFKGGGLGHAVYSPLMRNLSLTEIQTIFSYFGISPMLLLDYQDYYCQSKSNCVSRNFAICTSTC